MSKKFEKFRKKLFRVVGWIFEDVVKKKMGWLHTVIIVAISIIVFWFFGFFAVIKVYAVVLWIIAIGMIVFPFFDKAERGKSKVVKFLSAQSLKKTKGLESELLEEEKNPEKDVKIEQKKSEPKEAKEEKKNNKNKDDFKSNLPGIGGEPTY